MCRTLLAYLRGSEKSIHENPLTHSWCDPAGVHVAAHLVNALNFSVNYSEDFIELNAARYRDECSDGCHSGVPSDSHQFGANSYHSAEGVDSAVTG
ncbi:NADPH oxidase 4 [Tupaia chinensis]|uniref:NADPH oxidase 4 n=1 Tax=Tupaia chinensis TaxID=246437 RepID=L9JDP2_TUPCH|nr:NADPH oxidase 4 [Tupaia chinensis]